jgi:hypothetical protein
MVDSSRVPQFRDSISYGVGITIARSCINPHAVFECSFQLDEEADLAERLERLQAAAFLTGLAVQGAKVIDDDGGSRWVASPDVLHRLNGVLKAVHSCRCSSPISRIDVTEVSL